ncbi:hypothetical protein SBA5_160002 [Candidatus Sulfotelmatomonas gaucii]|uniref:Uncharacterized protein n=1 Tax=Candidatus Sulfuritelmatomonas gaucii TaxID=2043161 RepID=A0A2N9L5C9_9BACT|nr:hypothetical protein SBA5_160002 [Candidatus Sulfotelmatomonas gaucii]
MPPQNARRATRARVHTFIFASKGIFASQARPKSPLPNNFDQARMCEENAYSNQLIVALPKTRAC